MEPITAGDHYSILPRAGAEHRICGHDSEMWPCRASLIAHVEELETHVEELKVTCQQRGNDATGEREERVKEWADNERLRAQMEKARGLLGELMGGYDDLMFLLGGVDKDTHPFKAEREKAHVDEAYADAATFLEGSK